MSRERARRRAEREAQAVVQRQRRQRVVNRRLRRQRVLATLRGPLTRHPRADSALQRHRKRENGALLAVLLCAHAVLWLLQPSWLWRGSALVLTVVAWPLLTVLLFDRRPTP